MLLIHFGADFGADGATEDGRASQMPLLAEALLVDWYCRWADDCVSPVFVLFPESRRAQIAPVLPELEHASPVWYTDDGASLLPGIRHRGLVWIANGRHLPVVDWTAARSAARRHNTDVLIFGSSDAPAPHYLESVLVDDAGEVVRFKRHYCDSPGFTDLWDGEASFLAASGERAVAVVTHVLTRGWGLDSIGALTRRFSVQWSSTPCVLSEFGVTSSSPSGPTELGGQSRGWPGDPQREWAAGQRAAICSLSRFPEARAKTTLATADSPGHDSPGHDEDAPLTRRVSDPQAEERVSAPHGDLSEIESGDPVTDLDDAPAVSDSEAPERPAGDRAYLFLKRSIDLIASAVGIIVLSPLLLAVAATVRLTSPGPALFGDRRQGLGGKEFRCLKFRSMQKGASALQAKLRSRNEVDGPQFKIDNDPRVTKIGPWLRRSNIDELPQLFNVLLGQMSLVGPRPSPDSENQLCPEWRRTRLSVKPGITGLWQVLRLRNPHASDFQEWIYYDVEYSRHRSLWLDLQILLYTPVAMFAARRLNGFAGRLERHGICTRAAVLRRHYEAVASR